MKGQDPNNWTVCLLQCLILPFNSRILLVKKKIRSFSFQVAQLYNYPNCINTGLLSNQYPQPSFPMEPNLRSE